MIKIIGSSIFSHQIEQYQSQLFRLPALELEDYLDPGFADRDLQSLASIKALLKGYAGKILLSGPYIDLNPGSSESLIVAATRRRFEQAYHFATHIGASEIIFLSSFLPIIQVSYYERGWVAQSVAFWRSFMRGVDAGVTISLGNTFEFTPDLMVEVVEGLAQPNFRLAFDLGHFLVYGRVDLRDWMEKAGPYCSVVYVHSSDGRVDTHDAPYNGKLRPNDLALVAQMVPQEATYIAKMGDKDKMDSSVVWIKAHVDPDD
jgi:sugar phosphate isomerase/epimerase